MNLEELEKTDMWNLYSKCVDFMNMRNIYVDTDRNYRMYNGDQWYGLKIKGIEKIQYNFIKPIVKHKTSTITSNLFAVNYSPENIENSDFMETAQKTCDLLNKKASKVFDKDFLDKKIKKWAKQSAINDEAICYVDYDKEANMPINEIISKNDIMYGDENNDEIQLQPWILFRQRKSIIELQELARNKGVSEEQIKNIKGDNDIQNASGEDAKYELEDKCWLLTKLYRKNGTIHFSQSTKFVNIQDNIDTGLSLYPVAHWNWEDEEGNARGVGEVRQLIHNQLETNKTAMRRALSVKNTAYPQKVVNVDAIQNKSAVNKIGATIEFKDLGNLRASDVFMNTSPAQMSTDSEKFQTELINYSRDLNNAGDATTGSINPEQASGKAILAVQNAQNQPLTEQTVGLKSFIEDIARIWFDMWRTYAKKGLVIEVNETDSLTGELTVNVEKVPKYILDVLNTSVKVDITPKGAFDKYAQELSLENLFTNDKISFEEYVESLDAESVMPKTKLENILRKRKEAQAQIQSIDAQAQQMKNAMMLQNNNAQEIENIGEQGNALINQYLDNQAA